MGVTIETETIRFPVHGMTCVSCVNRITRSLKRLEGVSAIRVDLGRETATLTRRLDLVSDAAVASAVAEAGYMADLSAIESLPASEGRSLLSRVLRR